MPSSNTSKTSRVPTLRCAGSSASMAPISCDKSTSDSRSQIRGAPSHPNGYLAVLAKCRLRPGHEGLAEFEHSDRRARRPIPQFARLRLDPQQAYIGIGGSAGPPCLIGQSPNLLDLRDVSCHAGAGGDREVSFRRGVNKDKIDIGLGLDLILLCAADIGYDGDQADLRSGRGSAGCASSRPPACVVSMHTLTLSIM